MFKYELQLMLVLTHRYLCQYKNTTFVNILLIYSHYKPGKPFLKGAPFFLATPWKSHNIDCNIIS